MTLELKLIAGALILLALVGGVWGYGHVRYVAGENAGKAEVQALWEIDKAAIAKLADEAKAEAIATEDAAQRRNQGVIDDYQTALSNARASASALTASLRDARARLTTNSRAVSQTPNNPGAAPGAAAPGVGQADVLLGDALAECAATRAGYAALIEQLVPQL